MTLFIQIFVFAIAIFSVLGIASTAGIFSERVGIVNIGIDGMMIVGATVYGLFAFIIASVSGNDIFDPLNSWYQIPLIIISALFTMLYSWLHGLITIKLKGDHIISGVAINFLAAGVAWLFLILSSANRKFNVTINELAYDINPYSGTWGNILSLKTFILIFVILGAWFALNKTKWGLRFKSIGENPQAADVAGVNVNMYKWVGVSISGLLSGVAGSIMVQIAIQINNFQASVNGLGFLALSIIIMGQWKIQYSMLFAFLFSILYSLGITFPKLAQNHEISLEIRETLKSLTNLIKVIPYFSTLVLLVFVGKKSNAPKALGQPYEKSKR